MEFRAAVLRRRMVRDFAPTPLEPSVVADLCDLARRAPSAGNSQGCDFLVLSTDQARARYWDLTLPSAKRATFAWPGLLAAPVLVLVAVRPSSYLERYREADKVRTGLGEGLDQWAVPYWWVDSGAVAEHLLLGAVDLGLGACLFGLFDNEIAVAQAFDVPTGWRLVATVALGHPAIGHADRKGRSAGRPRRGLDEVIHRETW